MSSESEDDLINKKILLIEDFSEYLENIISDIDKYDDFTIESIKTIIIEYYSDRIDMNSEYFDPYAYVNDMNGDILDNYNCEKTLFIHFNSYLNKVIDGDIMENYTLDSLYKILKFYYYERIIPETHYFDNNAFIKNLNSALDDIGVSDFSDYESYSESSEEDNRDENNQEDNLSESSEDESNNTNQKKDIEIDPYISQFLSKSKNEDILLYKKSNKCIKNLDHFLNLNDYY